MNKIAVVIMSVLLLTCPFTSYGEEPGHYKDGVYTGSARGKEGPVDVSVTIRDGKVTGVDVVNYSNADAPMKRAIDTLAPEIIARQGTDGVVTPDGIGPSGEGVLNAAGKALKKARTAAEWAAPDETDEESEWHACH